MQGDFWGL